MDHLSMPGLKLVPIKQAVSVYSMLRKRWCFLFCASEQLVDQSEESMKSYALFVKWRRRIEKMSNYVLL